MAAEALASAEAERLTTQAELDASNSAPERNRLGQFATPPNLALEMAEYAKSLLRGRVKPIRFADPAAGTGAFFSAACAAFGRDRICNATGVELDPRFARAARELWGAHGLQIFEGDFTAYSGGS